MPTRIAVLAAAALWIISHVTLAADRPNVILVMCDDLGWGDLQCFRADSPIRTPELDAMAQAGIRFQRFYSAAPVCSPTRGSCLTGRHPARYGIPTANSGHLKREEITLPELLQAAGYATGHFGKWHLGTLTTEIEDSNRGGPRGKRHFAPPGDHGYDTCFVTEAKVPTYDPLWKPVNADRRAWDYLTDRSEAVFYGTRYWDIKGNALEENLEGDDSRLIMDRALTFIAHAVDKDKPFFAAVWFHAPHLPVVAGPEHVAPYASHGVYERNYYGCVAAMDEQVGRLRKILRELGEADDTMIWFCSDNGPEGSRGQAPGSAGPYRGRKRSLYEGGVRVPGILEWPGRVQPAVSDFPTVTSDYLPTILDLLDMKLPDGRPLDGISLAPVVLGEDRRRQQAIGFQAGKQRSLVSQRFKLISTTEGATWELYDLLDDPWERVNIADRRPDTVQQMREQLEAWQASCQRSLAGADYPP